MVAARGLFHFSTLSLFLIALLTGCESKSPVSGAGPDVEGVYEGAELPIGAYPILLDSDDKNQYEQWFFVRPGGEWEFAEFGFRRGTRNLVQLTRQIGVYKIDSGVFLMQITHAAAINSASTLSAAQISGFPFLRAHGPTGSFPVTNITANSFSATDMFIGESGRRTYTLGNPPMILTAPTPLPREFEGVLFVAPETMTIPVGEQIVLDLTGGMRSPLAAAFFIAYDADLRIDSNTTGRFTLKFPSEGIFTASVYVRLTDGTYSSEDRKIMFVIAPLGPVISMASAVSVKLNTDAQFPIFVSDGQGDLKEITWDFDGDGTVDFRSDTAATGTYVYRRLGKDTLLVVARDMAGHESRKSVIVDVTNAAPRFLVHSTDSDMYVDDAWKVHLQVLDDEKNLVDSAWWDFQRDGVIDTVTKISGVQSIRFDSLRQYDGWIFIKDELGLKDSTLFRMRVHGYEKMARIEFDHIGRTLIAFSGKLWAIGGTAIPPMGRTEIWSSPDGVVWTLAARDLPYGSMNKPQLAVFKGKLWLSAGLPGSGAKQNLWSSADGITWAVATETAPDGNRMLVYEDRLWLLGGKTASSGVYESWSSDDGLAWSKVGSAVPANAITVFQGRLLALAPFPDRSASETSYASADGVTWTASTFPAPWWFRDANVDFFEFNGKLWLSSANYTTWVSSDGIAWKQKSDSYGSMAPFLGDIYLLRGGEMDRIREH